MIASEFRGKKYVFRALEMRYGDFSKRGPMIVSMSGKPPLFRYLQMEAKSRDGREETERGKTGESATFGQLGLEM
jgi:hypothetical protein